MTNVANRIKSLIEKMIRDKRALVKSMSIVVILLLALIMRVHNSNQSEISVEASTDNPETESEELYVDIGGAVQRPGVYKVEDGTRLYEVIELAAREGMLDRLIFSSFNHYSMMRVKELDPGLYCGLLYDAAMVRPWAYAVALGADALHPYFRNMLLPGESCEKAHRAGIQVNPWTVNTEADIRAILQTGADYVITNYPDIALACLQAHSDPCEG